MVVPLNLCVCKGPETPKRSKISWWSSADSRLYPEVISASYSSTADCVDRDEARQSMRAQSAMHRKYSKGGGFVEFVAGVATDKSGNFVAGESWMRLGCLDFRGAIGSRIGPVKGTRSERERESACVRRRLSYSQCIRFGQK
jgi:hypothetical protein